MGQIRQLLNEVPAIVYFALFTYALGGFGWYLSVNMTQAQAETFHDKIDGRVNTLESSIVGKEAFKTFKENVATKKDIENLTDILNRELAHNTAEHAYIKKEIDDYNDEVNRKLDHIIDTILKTHGNR